MGCSQVPLLFPGCSKLAVSEDYICSLVDQANSKMHSNWARVQRFFELLRQPSPLQPSAVSPAEGEAKQHKGSQHAKPPSSKQTMLTVAVSSLPHCVCKGVYRATSCTDLHRSVSGLLGCGVSAVLRCCRQCKARRPCETAQGSAEAPAGHSGAPPYC